MRAVIRSRPFHTGMLRLAFAAILLLAFVPTLGRLAGAQAQGGWDRAGAYLTAICTVAGLKYVQLPAGDAGAADTPSGHPGADCDYCPLLASLLLLGWWLLAFPSPWPTRSTPRRGAQAHGRRRHPCGLGSRGPPRML